MNNSLSERIAKAQARLKTGGDQPAKRQTLAWQFLSELVAGLLVGSGIGFGLDYLFGSKPWLFVVFLLLGIAGAFWNMIRLASREEIVHTERD